MYLYVAHATDNNYYHDYQGRVSYQYDYRYNDTYYDLLLVKQTITIIIIIIITIIS